jgi:TolB-like protein/Tfp pilus assembly protein PilF
MWGSLGGGEPTDRAQSQSPEIQDRSIAVLPFEPLSSGKESETFARGVHDDLLTRLSNVSALKVISRTSVQQYRDTDLPLPAIADSLGVRWVMEGGVQAAGGRIQVNAQLIDPRTDAHVWAEDYQRDLTAEDLFAIQGEITGEIADALKAKLTAGEQSRVTGAPTENLQAYRLYVRGRRLMDSRAADSLEKAISTFESALQQDSTYALAWAGLADARILYVNEYVSEYVSDSTKDEEFRESMRAAIPEARRAARRALKLDPNLAEGYVSLGIIYMYEQRVRSGQKNGPAALEVLTRAVELKPSYAQAHHWLGDLYLVLGRPEAALKHLRLAVDLRPGNISARRGLVGALIANGKYQAALREARRLHSRYPKHGGIAKGLALLHMKEWTKVRRPVQRNLKEAEGAPGYARYLPVLADVGAGDTTSARRELRELGEEGWAAGVVLAALGEVDAAFKAWPMPVPSGPRRTHTLRYFFPDLLSDFRADPRYTDLIRSVNQEWGLNPDGSLPEDAGAPTPIEP